jgi:predicted ATPase/DNA-binding CsgD family transcriptional regulator
MQQATFSSPHNLPAQLTSLVGRTQEVAAVSTLLRRPEVRLLTLTGTGGIGKTRLAVQVGFELLDDFPDGVYFVPLAPISDPALALPAIADALGLREAGDWPLEGRVKRFLRERRLLLVLDNFEQILSAAAVLPEWLAACPHVKVLVTSRAVLHIRGEHEFLVTPLALPDPKHLQPGEGDTLSRTASVTLFVNRAQAIKPDFQITQANAQIIAHICLRLDGLPLAIELAAARIKLLPLQALLARLEHRLHVLISASQDVPIRQQTLRSTLSWSYELLSGEEQHLLRRLAVFVDGCTLEAAEAITGGADGGTSVLEGLAALIDKSLLQQVEDRDHEPRYVMLETIREYAWERLSASSEAAATQHAHAAYYLALVEQAEPKLTGAEQKHTLERLAREHENLRAALRWFSEDGDTERALRLGGALWWFWWIRGYVSEGQDFLKQVGAAGEEVGPLVRAKALHAAGTLAALQGHFDETERLCAESLRLFKAAGDVRGSIPPLWLLGYISKEQSEYVRARTLSEEGLRLSRHIDHTWGTAYSLENLAAVAFNQGHYQSAQSLVEESVAVSRKTGDTEGVARASWLLGLIIMAQGDLERARTLLSRSLALANEVDDKRNNAYSLVILGYVEIFHSDSDWARSFLDGGLALFRELGDRRGIAWALYGLGWIALGQNNAPAAQKLFAESLVGLRALGHRWFMALVLEGWAAALAASGLPEQAARFWGAAEGLRQAIDATLPPVVQRMYEPFLTTARTALGGIAFAAAQEEGRLIRLEVLLDEQEPVTAERTPSGSIRSSGPISASLKFPSGLTSREVEVLRLVAMGLTDIQIGERLVISPRTVSTHLTSIYNKLGVPTRSAATRFAVEQHLL